MLSRSQYAEAQRERKSRRKRIKEVRAILRINEQRIRTLVLEIGDQDGLASAAGAVR